MAAVQSAPKFPDICPQEIYGGKYVDRSPGLRPVSSMCKSNIDVTSPGTRLLVIVNFLNQI